MDEGGDGVDELGVLVPVEVVSRFTADEMMVAQAAASILCLSRVPPVGQVLIIWSSKYGKINVLGLLLQKG